MEPQAYPIGSRTRYIRRRFCDCVSGQAKSAAYHADLAQQEAERERTERTYRAKSLMMSGGLEQGKYRRFSFEQWDTSRNAPHSSQALKSAVDYLTALALEGQNWLAISGAYGIGKTHLAVAILREIVHAHLWTPHIVVWPELCQATQESWSRDHGPTEGQMWGKAKSAKVLLLDDLDKTATNEWAMGKLFGLINHRETMELPTIITSNRSVFELQCLWASSPKAHVRDAGMAVLSRIAGQLWGAIETQGDDLRWQA